MTASTAAFDIDAFGEFAPGRVQVHLRDTPRPTTPELEACIEGAWQRAMTECPARGAMLFNGELIRWIDHRVEDDTLHIDAGRTTYREFTGTNLYNRHRIAAFGRARFSNPIGTTATLISADGWLLYGRRSQRVAYHAGHVHTFGGALEAVDIRPDGTVDVFAALARELREELGLEPDEVTETVCIGLIHDREIWQPELLFDTTVRLTREALLDRLDRDADGEHTAIESLPDTPDAPVPFLMNTSPIAPVAIGALCLHGRRRWGERWYDETLARLGQPPPPA